MSHRNVHSGGLSSLSSICEGPASSPQHLRMPSLGTSRGDTGTRPITDVFSVPQVRGQLAVCGQTRVPVRSRFGPSPGQLASDVRVHPGLCWGGVPETCPVHRPRPFWRGVVTCERFKGPPPRCRQCCCFVAVFVRPLTAFAAHLCARRRCSPGTKEGPGRAGWRTPLGWVGGTPRTCGVPPGGWPFGPSRTLAGMPRGSCQR